MAACFRIGRNQVKATNSQRCAIQATNNEHDAFPNGKSGSAAQQAQDKLWDGVNMAMLVKTQFSVDMRTKHPFSPKNMSKML